MSYHFDYCHCILGCEKTVEITDGSDPILNTSNMTQVGENTFAYKDESNQIKIFKFNPDTNEIKLIKRVLC